MSAAASWSAASVRFGDGLDATLRRRSASAALEWRALESLTLTIVAGAAIDGDVTFEDSLVRPSRATIGPGPVGSLGVAYRIFEGAGWEPFVLLGGSASASSAVTSRGPEEARLTAVDVRVSVTVGEVFLDHLAPYLALRGFGGPIFWELEEASVTGSDRTHFQLGLGGLVTTGDVDAFFEIAPLGERAVTTGIAVSF